MDLLRFDWNKVNLHCDNVYKLTLSIQAYNMFQTSVVSLFNLRIKVTYIGSIGRR